MSRHTSTSHIGAQTKSWHIHWPGSFTPGPAATTPGCGVPSVSPSSEGVKQHNRRHCVPSSRSRALAATNGEAGDGEIWGHTRKKKKESETHPGLHVCITRLLMKSQPGPSLRGASACTPRQGRAPVRCPFAAPTIPVFEGRAAVPPLSGRGRLRGRCGLAFAPGAAAV